MMRAARRSLRSDEARKPSKIGVGGGELLRDAHWQIIGVIEALNGWLLFGLTTAFLFGVIERVRSSRERESGTEMSCHAR